MLGLVRICHYVLYSLRVSICLPPLIFHKPNAYLFASCSLLITYVGSKDPLVWRGYVYVAAMFIVACTRTLFIQQHWQVCLVTGMRLRTAIVGVVYRKVSPRVRLFALWRC